MLCLRSSMFVSCLVQWSLRSASCWFPIPGQNVQPTIDQENAIISSYQWIGSCGKLQDNPYLKEKSMVSSSRVRFWKNRSMEMSISMFEYHRKSHEIPHRIPWHIHFHRDFPLGLPQKNARHSTWLCPKWAVFGWTCLGAESGWPLAGRELTFLGMIEPWFTLW